MGIPCGYGLGAGITLVAGFPLQENFLDYFYDEIYCKYGHLIDFQGREDDFGALHITIFSIIRTKRGIKSGYACCFSEGEEYYADEDSQVILKTFDDQQINKIMALISEVLKQECFSITLKGIEIDDKSCNARLTFIPTTLDDKKIIDGLSEIPKRLSIDTKYDKISLHLTFGRVKTPFCNYKMPPCGILKHRDIEDKISRSIFPIALKIDRLKLLHYRRSNMLGINGYITIPLVCNQIIQSIAPSITNKDIVLFNLGIR